MRAALLLAVATVAAAHGDHTFDLDDLADNGMSYAERHVIRCHIQMHTEHHIDSFDLPSFFKLHDLDNDGYWDENEIKAVYGLFHDRVKDNIPQEELREGRTWSVVQKVLQRLDTDRDGKISLAEFEAGGRDGLPSFEGYKDLGHHYDEESEYFLHHEELYHSTPETQTDESYTHPEDIEHFRHHAHIEDEEDARERRFEGLPEEADLAMDHVISDPLDQHAHAPGEGPPDPAGGDAAMAGSADAAQQPLKAGDEVPPRLQRADPGASPSRMRAKGSLSREELERFGKDVGKGEKGSHDAHGRPRNLEERLKAGVPYSIGSAVAHAFIRAGCTKLIISDRDRTTLDFTLVSLRALASKSSYYTTLFAIPGDLSEPAFVDALFEEIRTRFGRLDYAVNCAGIRGNGKLTHEGEAEEFDNVTRVNARGMWLCLRRELGMMKGQQVREREGYGGGRRQRGAIVNVASQHGRVGKARSAIYAATKAAIISMTQCDAVDYSQHLIRINCVLPGVIDTPMTRSRRTDAEPIISAVETSRSELPDRDPMLVDSDVLLGPPGVTDGTGSAHPPSQPSTRPDRSDSPPRPQAPPPQPQPLSASDATAAIGRTPLGRMGTPDEVADVILFLCSERASFVQGAAWAVDGGFTAC